MNICAPTLSKGARETTAVPSSTSVPSDLPQNCKTRGTLKSCYFNQNYNGIKWNLSSIIRIFYRVLIPISYLLNCCWTAARSAANEYSQLDGGSGVASPATNLITEVACGAEVPKNGYTYRIYLLPLRPAQNHPFKWELESSYKILESKTALIEPKHSLYSHWVWRCWVGCCRTRYSSLARKGRVKGAIWQQGKGGVAGAVVQVTQTRALVE